MREVAVKPEKCSRIKYANQVNLRGLKMLRFMSVIHDFLYTNLDDVRGVSLGVIWGYFVCVYTSCKHSSTEWLKKCDLIGKFWRLCMRLSTPRQMLNRKAHLKIYS